MRSPAAGHPEAPPARPAAAGEALRALTLPLGTWLRVMPRAGCRGAERGRLWAWGQVSGIKRTRHRLLPRPLRVHAPRHTLTQTRR